MLHGDKRFNPCTNKRILTTDNANTYTAFHPNCHDQIVYEKLNLQINYPWPYFPRVWHHKNTISELMWQAINALNWQQSFLNTTVDEKVDIFNKTTLGIINNIFQH